MTPGRRWSRWPSSTPSRGAATTRSDSGSGATLRGEARFTDRGAPRVHAFDAALPGDQHRPPAQPDAWHPVPPAFLTALHECGRTTARESGRYALARVQVRGKAGQVVGTDGRAALVWGGFDLPFPDDVLVPALPVFGAREWTGGAAAAAARVGRTATHLVVAAGPWHVFLPADATGRYADVAGVAPRATPTVAGIDDRDAAALVDRLPTLPGSDDEGRPVTLDIDGGVVVRARDDSGTTDHVAPGAVGRDRAARPRRGRPTLRPRPRKLALGCARPRSPRKPVVFAGGDGGSSRSRSTRPSRSKPPPLPSPVSPPSPFPRGGPP